MSEKPEDAVSDYRKALALRPGDPHVIQRLGDLLCRAGRRQEGEAVLQPLLEADSDGIEMKKAKGAALLSLGEYRRALASFQDALSLDPDDPEAQEGADAANAALSSEHPGIGKGGTVAASQRSPPGDGKSYPGRGGA
jgi:superkiller protein 3